MRPGVSRREPKDSVSRFSSWDPWNTPRIPPESNEIRLYYAASASLGEKARLAFAAWLDETEQARRDRFPSEDARSLFCAAHGLVRYCLSLWLRDADSTAPLPGAWRFVCDALGKPVAVLPGAAGNSPPFFSLSHTRGGMAVAIGRTPRLGTDIESGNRPVAALGVAERYFTREERDDIFRQRGADAQRQRFILFWTLKEAYLKALGLGLTKSLSSFAFAAGETGARLLYDGEGVEADWRFRHFQTRDGMVGSLAAHCAGGSMRFRMFELDAATGWMEPDFCKMASTPPIAGL